MPIPIIDLFAGPGGLGEGFSALTDTDGRRHFKIKLSVEKDDYAHQTLELRAFTREFAPGQLPGEYYDYLKGSISRNDLFSKHRQAAEKASLEAWKATLGADECPPQLIDERIRIALGTARKWVLIGGPPCQAYSLVGRSRIIGGKGKEVYDADHRHELYKHYLRILAKHRPPVFVMENVKGLLSARVKDQRIFDRILRDLRSPLIALPELAVEGDKTLEYRLVPLAANRGDLLNEFAPEDFVLHAEDYGVPQARHRVIILGIRSDLAYQPGSLTLAPSLVTTEQVISDLPQLRSGLSREEDTPEAWRKAVRDLAEAQWIIDPKLPEKVRDGLTSAIVNIQPDLTRGERFLPAIAIPDRHIGWYLDPCMLGVSNHESRGHIRDDLHRYFFASVFAHKMGRSPLLEDFPKTLLPKHKNVEAALLETKFNDRFRVQLADRPSTTVVSHISKDGHYFIHYDSSQCRSLTVREAARLQTFPDNYFFEGPRTQQYKQVGNAVPPLLAKQIADVVLGLFD